MQLVSVKYLLPKPLIFFRRKVLIEYANIGIPLIQKRFPFI